MIKKERLKRTYLLLRLELGMFPYFETKFGCPVKQNLNLISIQLKKTSI